MKRNLKKFLNRLLSFAAFAALSASAVSCESIYDSEGDCDPRYYVRFVFDMNMEFADAFNEQVNSVELWVFDRETKEVVDHVEESGAALAADDFMVPLGVDPGQYHIVAWCGLKDNRHFKVTNGVTRFIDPVVRMERRADAKGRPSSDQELDELFHGIIDITAPSAEEMQEISAGKKELTAHEKNGTETVYAPKWYWDSEKEQFKVIYTVSLIRNTNNIVLSLEHLSGQFNLDELAIEMTDNNGTMLHDNRIDGSDELITYTPWRIATGTLDQGGITRGDFDINDPDNADGRYADFLTSEISTARMTTDHDKTIRIYYKDTDQTVFQIPVNKWISQLRSAKYQSMDEQEYLDREHNFELMVFLQDDGRGGWMAVSVVINGWHIIDNGEAVL